MFKKLKFYIFGVLFSLLLTSCGLNTAYVANNCTQKVIYDFMGGYCKLGDRNPEKLEIMYQPGSPISDLQNNLDSQTKFTFIKDADKEKDIEYLFEGWYFDKDFKDKVDFETYRLPGKKSDDITIYANWNKIYGKYFDLYYVDVEKENQEPTLLASIRWAMDSEFNINRVSQASISDETQYNNFTEIYGNGNGSYTLIDMYKDKEMQEKISSSYVLTLQDSHLPIYAKMIAGKYKVINTTSDFNSYINSYSALYNMYLNNDLDFANEGDMKPATIFGKTILGNNHTISNWHSKTEKSRVQGNTYSYGGIFKELEDCNIKDLIIKDAKFYLDYAMSNCRYANFGALAEKIKNTKIDNVQLTGKIIYTDKTLEGLQNGNIEYVNFQNDYAIATKYDTDSAITNSKFELTGILTEYLSKN